MDNKKQMFGKVVQLSGHGTSTGIWPRFFLQMIELAPFAIGKNEFDKNQVYFDNVMPQITKLYDIYHKFKEVLDDYREGIQSGKYYIINDRGQITHDKIPEVEIFNLARDFFINGKIMLVNFAKSGVIDDNTFKLEDFYFSDEKKFEIKKQEYLQTSDGRYLALINLLEKAQNDFLRPFNKIRGDIEHSHFKINDFKLEETQHGAFILEPIFDDRNLSLSLQFFYENILDVIEKLIVYFLGKNMEYKKGSAISLYVRHEYNYPNMLYKYTIAIGGNVLLGTPADKCSYS